MEDIRRQHGIGSGLMDVLTKATSRELVLSRTSASTAATRPPSGRSASRSGSCRAPTARGSSPRGQTQALIDRHPGPVVATCSASTRSPRRPRSATCTTTTSRRTRWARRGPMRGPGRREIGHGALAERALCCRSCRPSRSSRTSCASVSEVVSSQRLDLHGQHLRQHPGADGRRRADQGSRRRRGDGPHHRHRPPAATRC